MEDLMKANPVYVANTDGNSNAGGSYWWIIILFLFLFMGGNNGFGGNNSNSQLNAYATQADVQNGFSHNQVINKLDGISQGICSSTYELKSTIDGCCCETNRNIDSVKFNQCQNTNAILNAIHADGEATRALSQANAMQVLRDQLAQEQRANFANTLISSNQAQTQNLVSQLRPFPQPAYITCSPYTAMNGFGCCGGC